jgi:putative flippase GtrA
MILASAPQREVIVRWACRHAVKIRFLLAGGLNTCFGLAAFPALYYLLAFLDLHYLVILSMSHVLSVSFAFVTNKYLVFKTVGNTRQEYGRFIIFHAGHLAFNLAALTVLVHLSGLSPVWLQIIFAIAVIVSSYFWHSRITFSSKKAVS